MTASHYHVLGVEVGATFVEIRAAWRNQARRLHPDTGSGDEAGMRAVTHAWYVLRDPARRAAYDRDIGVARVYAQPVVDDAGDDHEAGVWDDLLAAADLAEDEPARTRAVDLVVMVPVGFFALAVASFSLGIALGSPSLLAVFLGSLGLSIVGFLLAPFFAMTRARRR